jgi:hypothetical protein
MQSLITLLINCKEKKLNGEISQTAITDGVEIMEDILHTWYSQVDGEDIVMSEAELPADSQLDSLQKLLEVYQTSIKGNPWLQSVLTLL